MVQFSIPAENTIIIGYSGMREPNPGWWQQEKTRVNSRKFKPAGRPFAQRSLACAVPGAGVYWGQHEQIGRAHV